MPQLRHAGQSTLVAEGLSVLDLATVAKAVGLDQVIFDDVGAAFDATVTIDAAADLARLDAASATWYARLRSDVAPRVVAALNAASSDGPDVAPVQIEA